MHSKLSVTAMVMGGLVLWAALSLAWTSTGTADAQEGVIPDWVGSDTCADCHIDIGQQHQLHGHNYILTPVSGEAPRYPSGEAPQLPEGYTWDDVSYVVGGFRWRARYLDHAGYVITGTDENAATQYNFPIVDERTGEVIVEANFEPYRPGEAERPYTCANCHSTGYNYNPNTHQDDMPGISGQWAEPGVQCEECHGPGSLHVEDPIRVNMLVNSSSQACGVCHGRGEPGTIRTSGGFILHHSSYNELLSSPHAALDCVTCHDPHQSVSYGDENVNPRQGMRALCTDCHFETPVTAAHETAGVTCTDCHMPPMGVSGSNNPDLLWSDLKAHLYQINTDPAAEQFTEDGNYLMPYITVRYACTRCHADWTVEEMAEAAEGMHADR